MLLFLLFEVLNDYLFFLEVLVLMERMLSMRDKSVFLPTYCTHCSLELQGSPHPSPRQEAQLVISTAGEIWALLPRLGTLFDITPGWPRLRDGPGLLLIDNIWNEPRKDTQGQPSPCSCLNIDYNASEAELDEVRSECVCRPSIRPLANFI